MQPEPQVYIAGAQRLLLELIESGKITEPSVVLSLRRIAETMGHSLLRRDRLPGLLGAVRERQQQLLRDVLAYMVELGVEPQPQLPASRASPEEGAIRAYDELGWAISLNLRRLAEHRPEASKRGSRLNALFGRARDLESEMREGYRAALAAGRAALGAGAGEPPPPLLSEDDLTAYLRTLPGGDKASALAVRQLVGINSKDIIFFDVEGFDGWPTSVVMRKMRGWNVNPLVSMGHEATLLGVLAEAGVPVPRVLAVDPEGAVLGTPSITMEKLAGAAFLPGGERADFGAEGGRAVGEQIAQHLAVIHSIPVEKAARTAERGLTQPQALQAHFGRYFKLWRDLQMEPSATLDHGFAWMMEKLGELDEAFTLVHGDLDFRNILFDGAHVTAVLDWERSHLGHPAEDLAYVRGDIEQIMDWEEFLALYRRHGGREVSPDAIRLFHMWSYLFKAASGTAWALEGYATGKYDHFLLASTAFNEGETWSDETRRLLQAAEKA